MLKHKNDALSHVSLHIFLNKQKKKYQGSDSWQTLPLVLGLERPLGVLSLSSKMEKDAAQRQSKQI